MVSNEYRERSTRYPLRVKARAARLARGPAADPVEGWTENLNGRGLFLKLSRPVKKGTRLNVTLELPVACSASHVKLECRCRVVWTGPRTAGRYGAGIAVEEVLFPPVRN